MSEEVRQRLLVAAGLIPVTAVVVWVGGAVFVAGLVLLAAVAAHEYVELLRGAGRPVLAVPVVVGAGAFPAAVALVGVGGAWPLAAGLLPVTGTWAMRRFRMEEGPITAAALATFGVLYVGGLLAFGVPLREGHLGSRLGGTLVFFLPVLVTWVADTAAFFGGRSLGERPLAPRISPNKTVEGAVASLVAGPLAAVLYRVVLSGPLGELGLSTWEAALLGLGVAVAAVGGDLLESALKRECAAKDASSLLPGHGGLLDRIDSLLWSIPVAHLLLLLLAGR